MKIFFKRSLPYVVQKKGCFGRPFKSSLLSTVLLVMFFFRWPLAVLSAIPIQNSDSG